MHTELKIRATLKEIVFRFATWHQLRIMKTDFHIYNKINLKISINKIQQFGTIAVM